MIRSLFFELAGWIGIAAIGFGLAVAAVRRTVHDMDRCSLCGSHDGPLHYMGPGTFYCPACCFSCRHREGIR